MPDPVVPQTPEPVYNCPNCSHWIPAGVLECPDCHTLVYGGHLGHIARAAQSLEHEKRWPEAREVWTSALTWMPPDNAQAGILRGHIAEVNGHIQSGEDTKARWTKRLGPLAPILLLLAKAKTALFLLFKLKFLLSFIGFFGLYWALFGWKFGLGFALSILVHELGHYAAVRRRGLKADLPVFLPGLGAYVRWYNMGIPLDGLASIALAGPLFGLFAALACYGMYQVWHQPVFLALAHTGAWINLLNLVPVLGLDGAQATYALNRLQRGLLLASSIVLFALMHEGVFLFIAAGMTWRMFTKDAPEQPSTRTLLFFLGLLFLLGAFLYVVPQQAITR